MSGWRLALICMIALVWVVILMLWMIGIGYEGSGFRLPNPFRDRFSEVTIFYAPLILFVSLASKPLLKKYRKYAPNK